MKKSQATLASSLILLALLICCLFKNTGKPHIENEQTPKIIKKNTREGTTGESQAITSTIKERATTAPHKREIDRLLGELRKQDIEELQKASLRYELIQLLAKLDPQRGVEWINSLDAASEDKAGASRIFGIEIGKLEISSWETYARQLQGSSKISFIMGALSGYGINNTKDAWDKFQQAKSKYPELGAQESTFSKGLSYAAPEKFWPIAIDKINSANNDSQALSEIQNFFKSAHFKIASDAIDAITGITDSEIRDNSAKTYIGNLNTGELADFAKSVNASSLDQESKDKWTLMAADELYGDNIGEAAKMTNLISNQKLRDAIRVKILQFANKQGADVETSVKEKMNK